MQYSIIHTLVSLQYSSSSFSHQTLKRKVVLSFAKLDEKVLGAWQPGTYGELDEAINGVIIPPAKTIHAIWVELIHTIQGRLECLDGDSERMQ